ncbi:MAG: HEAT repeat domain-containing protein [Pseudobdellovibrionaceae bacterium]
MIQKKRFWGALALVLVTSGAQAAVDKSFRASEILSLPEENRKVVFKEKGTDIYGSILVLADSDATPMSLRWKAINSLAQIDQKKAVPNLLKIAKSKVWHARNASLVALQTVNSEKAKTVAGTLLFDPALVVRSAAVEVLKSYSDSVVREQLWEALQHPQNFRKGKSLWVRRQIAHALAQYPKMYEQELFERMSRDADPRVRAYGTVAKKTY